MSYFAASGSTHESNLSHRERREVVVEHEAFLGFALEAFQSLHVVAGAEGGRDQRLGFTARKNRAAVGARQDADFNPDVANLIEGAAVGTAFVLNDCVAEDIFA